MSHKNLDALYDYRRLCQVLFTDGAKAAICTFKEQAAFLENCAPKERPLLGRTMLVSLNRSLYNFILFTQNLSLAGCCFDNMCEACHCKSYDEFLEASARIICSYAKKLQTSSKRSSRQLDIVCSYIKEHLQETLTLEHVARHTYLSRSQICRLFRSEKNESFSQYVCQERVLRAKMLLASGEYSITQTAQLCGFSSSAYFSKIFKGHTGYSPKDYRNRIEKEAVSALF